MIVLAGADIVLADRILSRGSILIDGDRIAAIEPRVIDAPAGATRIDVSDCVVVPGFIDVHVHGVEGRDVLDGPGAVAAVAARLPKYGVTAFCPTSIACDPPTLQTLLSAVATARARVAEHHARVLPAHLESNFINPDYKGAQPAQCLRTPVQAADERRDFEYTGGDIVDMIAAHREGVGIVTLAPEIAGGLELVSALRQAGHIVSIGHTGATYEEARDAIFAGVSHATHLFNRMTPMTHRAPGVPGAVLESEHVCAELICDGFHVHPALMRLALRAKGADRVMAITDGTAGSGLPVGTVTHLGGRPITVTERTAVLEDGTLAGSVLTMDAAFRTLVHLLQLSYVDAARLCATTPARQLGLKETGFLEAGAVADLAVLDASLQVRHTFLRGVQWRNSSSDALV
jgi:N-acetylglucosamine-6-phosphate deacetylase